MTFNQNFMVPQLIAGGKAIVTTAGIVGAGYVAGPLVGEVINEGTSISVAFAGTILVTTVTGLVWLVTNIQSIKDRIKRLEEISGDMQGDLADINKKIKDVETKELRVSPKRYE